MHLLFVVNDLAYFRAHRERLALDIQAMGNQVSVVSGNCEGVDMTGWDERINVYPLNLDKHRFRPRTDTRLVLRLRKLMKTIEPDIVQCVTIKPILYGGLAATLCRFTASKPKLLWTFAGLGKVFEPTHSFPKILRRKLVAYALRFVRAVTKSWATFENNADRQFMIDNKVVAGDRAVALMGTGIDTDHFSPGEADTNTEAQDDAPLVFYMATRLIGAKGVHEFLTAAKHLNADNANCRCVLAGLVDTKNPDAVPEESIMTAVERGDIEYLGAVAQQDIPKTLRAADVFCLPTRLREGFPRALLEAASCGVAIIATDQPPMRTLVPSDKTGWLIEPPTVEELEAKMRLALAQPDLTRQMGRNARELVDSLPVDAPSIAKGFAKVYEGALKG